MKNLFVVFLMLIAVSNIFGQNKKELYNKLKEIDDNIKSITITTDKGDVTFKGEDAEYLFRKLKSSIKQKSFRIVIPEFDDDFCDSTNNIMMWLDKSNFQFDLDSLNKKFNFNFKFDGPDTGAVTKKIDINMEGNDTTLTVTTTENGEVTTKIYTGKDATDFIKKHETDSKETGKKKKVIIKEFKSKDDE